MNDKPCQLPGGPAGRLLERPADERRAGFAESTGNLKEELVRREAARCLAALDCIYCEVCELLCPDLCIIRDPATGDIQIDLDHCKGCGLCAHFCPKGAIRMEIEKP